jgi:type I restriction enzyme M protein
VSVAELAKNGFNLDVKNPHVAEEEKRHSSAELLGMLHESFRRSDEVLASLKKELGHG